jgi:hypothetical protein
VNARDIAGYSILSILGAYNASERTIPLIPLLTRAGADLNIKTRFDEVHYLPAAHGRTRAVPPSSVEHALTLLRLTRTFV